MKFKLIFICFFAFFITSGKAMDSCKHLLRAEFVAISSCPSQDIGLFNTSFTSHSKVSYHWQLGDGRTSIEKQPKVSYPVGNQMYTISLDVFDSVSKCRAYCQKNIWIYDQPKNKFSSEIRYSNNETFRYFKVQQSNPIEHSYTWYLPNHDSIYIVGSNELWLKDTYHLSSCKIALKVKSNDGCVSTYSKDYRLLSSDDSQIEKITIINKQNGETLIQNLENQSSYTILNHLGQAIQSGNIESNQLIINNLTPGFYHFLVLDSIGKHQCFQFVVY
jgi:hypothetical protein